MTFMSRTRPDIENIGFYFYISDGKVYSEQVNSTVERVHHRVKVEDNFMECRKPHSNHTHFTN